MIVDIRSLPSGTVVESDLCIIGAGAAGVAMAMQLAGATVRVSLLESGGLEPDAATQALAAGEQSGVPYFDLATTRYRLLGGSTLHWGARSAPLKSIDFARRAWVPHSGWPLAADALDPYFDRVFDLIGLHRPFAFDAEVWKLFDHLPPALDANLVEYSAFQFGKNLLLGKTLRKQLRPSGNVTAYLHANALGLQATPRGDHVTGVDVAALTGQRYLFKARRYVLACGGIENARLLLLSNAIHPAGLCNERDLVGRYFMEHPTVPAGTMAAEEWRRLQPVFSPGLVGGHLVEIGMALSPRLQEARRCLNAVARAVPVLAADSTQALRELLWSLRRRSLPPRLVEHEKREWLLQRLGAVARDPLGIAMNALRHASGRANRFNVDRVLLEIRTEQAPNPDSRVTLSDRTDALGQRCAHLHWALTREDKRTMQTAAEAFAGEMRRLGWGAVQIMPWLETDDPVWPPDMVGGHHHMGTTRMSADPHTGVVDESCKAHTMDNLYIAGSSVFPTAGYANPTLTILALAIRLADHLR